jgi:hypothetical protein
MESFFSSDDAKADVFDYIERFYNPKRRHSTIGYLSPEQQTGLAQVSTEPGELTVPSRQPGRRNLPLANAST